MLSSLDSRDSLTVENSDVVQEFLSTSKKQMMLIKAKEEGMGLDMATSVLEGLSKPKQKELSATYFYDEYGSQLYEKITKVPEYYPTRTERLILETLSEKKSLPESISQLIELGSGSSEKTRLILDALKQELTYIPIDVSETMLNASAHQLAKEYPELAILAIAGDYQNALRLLPQGSGRLFLFLGGTLGNFTQAFQNLFFASLLTQMTSGNHLLIGFDCSAHETKTAESIRRAYDDSQGVTAQFNLNILTHINRKLNANFVLEQFKHQAIYNTSKNQIEMHLVSTCDQKVLFPLSDKTIHFKAGETILTEISRKFEPLKLQESFSDLGYQHVKTWHDSRNYFGLMLLKKP